MTNQINNRNSFIFYRSFFETIEDLDDKQQLEIYRAIAEFSLNNKRVELGGLSKTIFRLIEPQLEANRKRFLNGQKGAEHGKKGGRPKTPKKPQDNPEETPNLTPNKNVNDNLNPNVNKDLKSKSYSSEIDELTEGLKFVLEAKLNRKLQTRSWREEVRKLLEIDLRGRQDAVEDVKRVIQEIANRFGEQYFPVIQSASALREKFSKVEAAISRNSSQQTQSNQDIYNNLLAKYENE